MTTITLSEEATKQIQNLSTRLNCTDIKDVTQRAFALLDMLADHQSQEGRIELIQPNGIRETLPLLKKS